MKTRRNVFLFISIFCIHQLFSNETGNKILLLFQSKEGQSVKENLSAWHLVPILKDMNFEMEFVDINSSLPDADKMDDVYAVIGWLSGNARKNPLELVYWYEKLFKNDIRLILMGAIGCWQDETTKQYLPDNEVNKIFSKLGVIYKGMWTNQKNKINLEYVSSEVYPKGFSITEDIDYFNFITLADDIVPYIRISRKDMANSESVVAFSSLRGGYIFTNQYVLKDNVFLVDLKKFLKKCLFYTDGEQHILVSGINDGYVDKMMRSFDMLRIRSGKAGINLLMKYGVEKMGMHDLIILEGLDYAKAGRDFIQRLNAYTQNGGGLVIAGGHWTKDVMQLFGLAEIPSSKVFLSSNIYFKPKIFPGSDKLKLILSNKDPYMNVRLSRDTSAVVFGKMKDNLSENVPFVWERSNGSGRIIVWKSDLYYLNEYRSLFTQTSLSALNGHAQFFANIAAMFLDDFPIPSYNIVRNIYPIPAKENLDDTDFYLNYALPNVLDVLKKYKIPLTAFAIFSYDQDISPPFKNGEYYVGKDNAYKRMMDRLYESGCEIGLHGYNHQSLSLSSTVTLKWLNQENMEESLKVAGEDYELFLGKDSQPFSYVAPMNVIDDAGLRAIGKVFPSIKVISTLFNKDESSYETIMDFGVLPGTGMYKMPRTTYGYQLNDVFLHDFNFGIWNFGAWTHFIHLDDSYDTSRNKGILWNNLVKEFDVQIDYVKKNYPFMRYYLVRDAYRVLMDYEQTEFKFYRNKSKKEIDISVSSNNSKTEKFIAVRLPDGGKLKNMENGEPVYIFPDREFIIIKTVNRLTRIFYE